MIRDPRQNPAVGDELRRLDDGIRIKVLVVTPERIDYQWFSPAGRSHYNSWTLAGWRNVVAKDAKILCGGETGEKIG